MPALDECTTRFRAGNTVKFGIREFGGVETLPMGEEEVEVTESAAPVNTGAWCKREMLRH
ncbi:hypothetical protein E6R60_31185 [Streptomyces sp. A0642]|uniref:hypothetical protein n=1 Tax=unclassified Streptomyces TaxID=2593676 RepID=UPI0010A281B5|nr:hypothetical protein [Streptomyces sp. A0642]THA68773.1 hypothetical protein E6R60_31185 [Streptomyces sp. A0642]